jgi:diguanylate cyclase (GGDEF)-like protein
MRILIAEDDAISRRLLEAVLGNDGYDTVGRYSGDEFIILLPGCNEQQAKDFAERLQARFTGQALETGDGSLEVGMSMGVAAWKTGGQIDEKSLIHQAECALHLARSRGPGSIACTVPDMGG